MTTDIDQRLTTYRPAWLQRRANTMLTRVLRKGRGPNKAPTKKLVSIRLSGQVLDAYKAMGPGWQSRIDRDLRRINKIK